MNQLKYKLKIVEKPKRGFIRKSSDLMIEEVNASLCWELDFKGVDYELGM